LAGPGLRRTISRACVGGCVVPKPCRMPAEPLGVGAELHEGVCRQSFTLLVVLVSITFATKQWLDFGKELGISHKQRRGFCLGGRRRNESLEEARFQVDDFEHDLETSDGRINCRFPGSRREVASLCFLLYAMGRALHQVSGLRLPMRRPCRRGLRLALCIRGASPALAAVLPVCRGSLRSARLLEFGHKCLRGQ